MPSESSTPTTDLQPTSTSPAPQVSPSSAGPAWLPSALTLASSTALAALGLWKVAGFLPSTMALLVRDGRVSTDAIAWAPFGLTLLALVAIASPVSLGPLLGLVRAWLPGGKAKE